MTHIVVDPVTRIEGHLRIEAEVDGGRVKDAWSSATMFRGVELILKGRDPRDAWAFTQRICGVCTTVHAIASIRAVENAIGAQPPQNARLLRNLIMAYQCVQDHVIHFYHLHALDWVDVVSALSADPAKTSALAESISDWPLSSTKYFAGVKGRLKTFVERGQLGPFANAYWGHPAYVLPPEANLMAVAHYLEALDWQRDVIRAHAILGGKNPHLQSFLVGGMATPIDPDRQASINVGSIAELKQLVAKAKDFVSKVYIPDLLAVASFYKAWAGVGGGVGNYLVYGEYPEDDGPNPPLFLPSGVLRNKDLSKVEKFDAAKITEHVKHSWYDYSSGDEKGIHPSQGETKPNYTGPTPPYEKLDGAAKYSWLKAPRYDGLPMEVGPLSRMLVAYASGHARVKELVGDVLKKLGVGPEALFSTLGRVAARGIETLLLTEKIDGWIDQLAVNMHRRQLTIHDNSKWEPTTWPKECDGSRLPRGPARGPRPLGAHRGRRDRQLPVHRAQHVERGAAGRPGQARAVRGSAPEHARGRSHEADRDPADDPLLRPLHRVRRPRRRREEEPAREGEGRMSTSVPFVVSESGRHYPIGPAPPEHSDLVRVYVWEWPVRLAHWGVVLSIAVLAVTGIYIGQPVHHGHRARRGPLPDGDVQGRPLLRGHPLHAGRPLPPDLDVPRQPLRPLGQVHPGQEAAAPRPRPGAPLLPLPAPQAARLHRPQPARGGDLHARLPDLPGHDPHRLHALRSQRERRARTCVSSGTSSRSSAGSRRCG